MMRCGMLGCILTTMLLRRRQLEETRFERIAGAWNLQRLCAQPACILRPQGATARDSRPSASPDDFGRRGTLHDGC
ncbi:hypothetical protein C8F01DRAFT_1176301 [Mycena amicta]|nr:hypothetical protein C8F01DRAFT_1176301 [Mycena amicta]